MIIKVPNCDKPLCIDIKPCPFCGMEPELLGYYVRNPRNGISCDVTLECTNDSCCFAKCRASVDLDGPIVEVPNNIVSAIYRVADRWNTRAHA